MKIRFLKWFLFTLVVSLAPIIVSAVALKLVRETASLERLLGNGELLMISCALAATAIGELIASKARLPHGKLILVWLCGIAVFFSTMGYAILIVADAWKKAFDKSMIANFSIALFIGTGICAAICVVIAPEK